MLRFLAAFAGPMFAKELVEMARRKRYYFNRVLYVAALLLALFIVWQEYRYLLYAGNRLQRMAEMASMLFMAVGWVQYGAVYLFVPVFLAGVIAVEREGHTLDLLLTTQLDDRQIVLGKLASRLAMVFLLIASALPVMSLVMLFGGINPASLLRAEAATLLAMFFAGAHAIYFSSISKSATAALVRTYWWLAVFLAGVPAAALCLVETLGIRQNDPAGLIVWGLLFINPFFVFVVGIIDETYRQFGDHMRPFVGEWFFPLSFVVPSAWSALLIWRAKARLRLPPTPLNRLGAWCRATWKRWTTLPDMVPETGQPLAGNDVAARRHATWWGLEVQNPLWLRARQARVYDREGHIGRIQWAGWAAAAFFLGIFLLFDQRSLAQEECPMVFLSATWIGAAGLVAILAATGLVGDRRRGFLDLVLVTPLDSHQIVDGVLLSIWHHVRRVYWLILGLTVFFVLTKASGPIGAACSVISGTLFVATVVMLGTACSLVATQPGSALAPTFVFILLMTAGTGLLVGLFEGYAGPVLWIIAAGFLAVTWFWSRRSRSPAAVGCHFMAVHLALVCLATCWTYDGYHAEYPIVYLNPAVLTIATLSDLNRLFSVYGPYGFSPHSRCTWWQLAIPCYWAALVVNLIWARWWMIRHFDRLTGRAGQ
ncbi:MAG: ABC transporter permease subunit [Pirellulales bacterium]